MKAQVRTSAQYVFPQARHECFRPRGKRKGPAAAAAAAVALSRSVTVSLPCMDVPPGLQSSSSNPPTPQRPPSHPFIVTNTKKSTYFVEYLCNLGEENESGGRGTAADEAYRETRRGTRSSTAFLPAEQNRNIQFKSESKRSLQL